MRKLVWAEFWVLLLGTLFAWGNFARELYAWLQTGSCADVSCSLTAPVNPFLTPCFFGALFFTVAFILSAVILKRENNK